jgi:hypothetical protein
MFIHTEQVYDSARREKIRRKEVSAELVRA